MDEGYVLESTNQKRVSYIHKLQICLTSIQYTCVLNMICNGLNTSGTILAWKTYALEGNPSGGYPGWMMQDRI